MDFSCKMKGDMSELNIQIDGINISYKVLGEGSPIILLHGWGGSCDSFMPVAQYFKKYFKVYMLDFPGFGKSDLIKGWDVTDYSDMLIKWVDKLKLRGAHVIAHSFGCRVAILSSARESGLFGKMIFTGAAGLIPRRSIKYYFKIYSYKCMKRLGSVIWLKNCLKKIGCDIEGRIKKRAGSTDYRSLTNDMKMTFVKVVNQDLKGYLKDIDSPTLLIWGENDSETPLSNGKIMEIEIPDAGLVILKNAGHFAYLECLPAFIKISENFLTNERA